MTSSEFNYLDGIDFLNNVWVSDINIYLQYLTTYRPLER